VVQETVLTNWQTSPAIRHDQDTNHLELTCAGSTIDLSANGQSLATVQDTTYTRGIFTMATGVFPGQGASSEARFDNLVLTRR
jgi:hypothetical protein